MKDPRPLSERFDLTYVGKKHLADRWIVLLSWGVVSIGLAWLAVAAMRSDETPYTSGPLTHAHAMFADNCNKCHAGEGGTETFFSFYRRPVEDAKCRECHVAPAHNHAQSKFIGGTLNIGGTQILTSSNCAACHVEHQGGDHRLTAIPDSGCVQCHADLSGAGRASPHLHGVITPSAGNGGDRP